MTNFQIGDFIYYNMSNYTRSPEYYIICVLIRKFNEKFTGMINNYSTLKMVDDLGNQNNNYRFDGFDTPLTEFFDIKLYY
jgi:hypothetical protein